MIILQTVLQEVQHLNGSVYKRIRDIISSKERKFFVFSNEHHRLVKILCYLTGTLHLRLSFMRCLHVAKTAGCTCMSEFVQSIPCVRAVVKLS